LLTFVAAAVVFLVFHHSRDPMPATPPGNTDATTLPTASPKPATPLDSLDKAPVILSDVESEELRSRLGKAEFAFREIERTQANFIAEVDEDDGKLVVSVIPTPSKEIYERYSDALSDAMKGASDRLAAAGAEKQAALFDSFARCSTPYRLVSGFLPLPQTASGRKRTMSFSEQYVEEGYSVVVNENRSITYRGSIAGKGFEDKGVHRYSYLFENYLDDIHAVRTPR
jgi:hypothetical protein